ncbi:DUF5988 family protein [Nonomuraea sp. NPDC049709]|uniref:DUF5988 family protein n=1 Tax=Nonomuraea sp. NPDC049709 TaxID=3154736 RepID=UPI00344498C6
MSHITASQIAPSQIAPSQIAPSQIAPSRITAVLVGGPDHLAADRRIQSVGSATDTLKLPHGAGYEHFRHQGESTEIDGERALVFRWIMHTAIAE